MPEHVIVVDDFEVPGDAGYRYDDYGGGKRLCLEYISAFADPDVEAFFPSTRSPQETGRRRGCCVLSGHAAVASRLLVWAFVREFAQAQGKTFEQIPKRTMDARRRPACRVC